MPKGARFDLNPQGAGEVLHGAAVSAALRRTADQIADRARSIAPVDTGAYRDSIHVEDKGGETRDRYWVIADDYKAAWVEYGTPNTPARRVLGRAVDAAGS